MLHLALWFSSAHSIWNIFLRHVGICLEEEEMVCDFTKKKKNWVELYPTKPSFTFVGELKN